MRRARADTPAGSQPPTATSASGPDEPFEIGGFYLDRPHRDRGGFVYACRYDAGAGCVRRRTLGTTDWAEAKIKLAALVLSAPATTDGQIPGPGQVMTVAALANYIQGHATTIRSEADAIRAADLAKQYLETHVKNPMAPVSFWTPSRQLEFSKWLRDTFGHSPASIERRLDVVCAAFHEMTEVKLRLDPFGQTIETALMTHAPKFVYKRARIAKELKIAPSTPRHTTHSLDDIATVLDALDQEHLFRFSIVALNTWARPEAVSDFNPLTQRRNGLIDLNPPDRVQTNKRRPLIPETRNLAGWISIWAKADAEARALAVAAGREPAAPGLLTFNGKRVQSVKKAMGRAAVGSGVTKFSPGSFRHFMATTVRRLCRNVTREQRSLWLGHVVKEGSRTTDNYEAFDAEYLADVALATDFVMQQLQAKCKRRVVSIETRLNRNELERIGARENDKSPYLELVTGRR